MSDLELKDIHLPDASLWWPLAPGWWILFALLVGLAILLPWLLRRRRDQAPRRLSLIELQGIERAFAAHGDSAMALRELSRLLRRTLISYRGRAGFADSSGDAWTGQLRELASRDAFDDDQLRLLAHERYRRDCECDIDRLLESSRRWLQALPRRRTDVAA